MTGTHSLNNEIRSCGEHVSTPGSFTSVGEHAHHDEFISKIKGVCYLPVEMWQKIACNLDYESYNALRCVSKEISGILPLSTLYDRVSDKKVILAEDTRKDYVNCLSQHSFLALLTSFSPLSRHLLSRMDINCFDSAGLADAFMFNINILSESSAANHTTSVTQLMSDFKVKLFKVMPDEFLDLESTLVYPDEYLAHFANENSHDYRSAESWFLDSNRLFLAFETSKFYGDVSDAGTDKAIHGEHVVKPRVHTLFDCLQKYTDTLDCREKIIMQVVGHKLLNCCLENTQEGLPRSKMEQVLAPFSVFFSDCARIDRMLNYVVDSTE